MARNWTQKHIEELIRAELKGRTGGGGYNIIATPMWVSPIDQSFLVRLTNIKSVPDRCEFDMVVEGTVPVQSYFSFIVEDTAYTEHTASGPIDDMGMTFTNANSATDDEFGLWVEGVVDPLYQDIQRQGNKYPVVYFENAARIFATKVLTSANSGHYVVTDSGYEFTPINNEEV